LFQKGSLQVIAEESGEVTRRGSGVEVEAVESVEGGQVGPQPVFEAAKGLG